MIKSTPGAHVVGQDRMRSTINVVAADSQPLILMGVERLLSDAPELNLVETYTNGSHCLEAVNRHSPDILILDLDMSEMDGLEVLRRLVDQASPVKVVLLIGSVDEARLLEAMRLGVQGVVLKDMAPSFLVQCLRKVGAGEQWIEKQSFGRALSSMLKRENGLRQASDSLTAREIELTRLVAEGLSNRGIAHRLHISEGTVKVHLHRIYTKLGLKNRVGLMLYAKEIGLV
jgi:DNA-binding NarL/FixJ family response regulator